jgi:hypothetical protein
MTGASPIGLAVSDAGGAALDTVDLELRDLAHAERRINAKTMSAKDRD